MLCSSGDIRDANRVLITSQYQWNQTDSVFRDSKDPHGHTTNIRSVNSARYVHDYPDSAFNLLNTSIPSVQNRTHVRKWQHADSLIDNTSQILQKSFFNACSSLNLHPPPQPPQKLIINHSDCSADRKGLCVMLTWGSECINWSLSFSLFWGYELLLTH